MKVLVGIRQPRIIYLDSSNQQTIGASELYDGEKIRLEENSAFVSMTSAERESVMNTCVYAKNNSLEDTWSVMTKYTYDEYEYFYYIYCRHWSNGIPKINSSLTSKYYGYDLPYCQNNLIETFTPEVIMTPLWNGTRDFYIKGFWYSARLDYSNRSTPSITTAFTKLYDSERDYSVMLYPRKDNLGIGYAVDLNPDSSVTLAQKMNHLGMKYFVADLIGTTRLSSVNLDSAVVRLVTENGEPLELVDGTLNYLLGA